MNFPCGLESQLILTLNEVSGAECSKAQNNLLIGWSSNFFHSFHCLYVLQTLLVDNIFPH